MLPRKLVHTGIKETTFSDRENCPGQSDQSSFSQSVFITKNFGLGSSVDTISSKEWKDVPCKGKAFMITY